MDNRKNLLMQKDIIRYLPAKVIEGVVGFLTLSVLTYYLVPGVFAQYTLISNTINIVYTVLISWMVQFFFRNANMIESDRKSRVFFSTGFICWLSINVFVWITGTAAALFLSSGGGDIGYLIIFCLLAFSTYSVSQFLFGIMTARRMVLPSTMLSVFSCIAKILLILLFFIIFKHNVSTPINVIYANIVVDIITIIISIKKISLLQKIRIRLFSLRSLKRILSYGTPLALLRLNMSMLNLSDRYLLIFILGAAQGTFQMGIYSANYSLVSAFFTLISVGIMRGVYPNILKKWDPTNKNGAAEQIGQALRYYVLLAMPSAFGMSAISYHLSGLLLKKAEYLGGSLVIVPVSFGMFVYGLTEYANKPFELTNKTSVMFKISLISSIFNIVCNIILIPFYGFWAAAYNTLLSYLLYFILSFIMGRKVIRWKLYYDSYIKILVASVAMFIVVAVLSSTLRTGILSMIIMTLTGICTYFLVLLITGELKKEIGALK